MYIEQFKDQLLYQRNLSPNTINSYMRDLETFNQFLESESLTFESFEYRDARNFLHQLYQRNLKKSTIARNISTLRTFYQFLISRDHVATNPLIICRCLSRRNIYQPSSMKMKLSSCLHQSIKTLKCMCGTWQF